MSDQEIVDLVEKMHSKIPSTTKLNPDTCINVIKKKYPEKFANTNWEEKKKLVADTIARLDAPPPVVAAAKKQQESKNESSDDSDDDDSDDDEDDSDDDDDEEEEDDEDEEEEDDDEGEDDSDEESAEAGDGEDAPDKKKRRTEEGATAGGDAAQELPGDASERATAMMKFLRKAEAKYRKPNEGESWEDFIKDALVPVFTDEGMDPTDLSKPALKRMKIRMELKVLQQEADINLDPRTRRGRATAGQPAVPPPKTHNFLDDD